ncbi:hypothetical protein GCM10027449_19630 [Sinomonas notoginsengisoli]|uniref:phosphatase PAP2 family protein n=1 Tax=Sinomonas notoginsengisoli TaxID=1457311 RepID=UPI001F1B229A|nr:phosphatase PAP2 family protein [Sinomonas notoginsengisoli]
MPAHRAPAPGPFLLAGLLAAAACAGTYWAFVRTRAGQELDQSALLEAAAMFGSWSRDNLTALNSLPAAAAAIAAAALAHALLVRRRRAAPAIALTAALGANAASYVLKHWALARPDFGFSALGENTLPSGHATLTASAAAAVFLVAPPRWRPAAAFAGATYAAATGLVMLVNHWHLPADVVAAFCLVAAVMAPALWIVLHREGRKVTRAGTEDAERRWLRRSVRASLAAASVTAVSLLLILAVPHAERRAGTVPQVFAAAAGGIVAVGYAGSAAAIRLAAGRRTA